MEGGIVSGEGYESGCYVKPCVIEAKNEYHIVQEETFAPLLYLIKYSTIKISILLILNITLLTDLNYKLVIIFLMKMSKSKRKSKR